MGRKHEKTREDCGVGLLFCTHHEAYDSQERAVILSVGLHKEILEPRVDMPFLHFHIH